MKKGLLVFLLFFSSFISTAQASNFNVCKSTYALCTFSKCTSVPGKKGFVACDCRVRNGYSAATQACQPMKETSKGKQIVSRYYPIKAYHACTNNGPWAWCLDSPCLINKKNPSQASCLCSVAQNQGAYILSHHQSCHKGIYSSATVDQATEITNFLKGQSELQPYPVKVFEEK